MSNFAAILGSLKKAGPPMSDYADAREAGYYPVQRVLNCIDGELNAILMLAHPDREQIVLESRGEDFVGLCLAHLWVMDKPLAHAAELGGDLESLKLKGAITIRAECGLFRADSKVIKNFVVDDTPTERQYHLLVPILDAQHLCPIPSSPKLKLQFMRGGKAIFTLPVYVDQLAPATKDGDTKQYVAITGSDMLTGSRAIITAGYNLTGIAGDSLVKLGLFLNVPELKPDSNFPNELKAVQDAINGADKGDVKIELGKAIEAVGSSLGDEVQQLAAFFSTVLADEEIDSVQLGASFLNTAWALAEDLRVAFAVGHIQGIKTDGAIRIAPNVLVCSQDQQPVHLPKLKDDDAPICSTWPHGGALMIVFYLGGSAPETTKRGGEALQQQFTLLSNVLCDTGWLETTDSGEPIAFFVDSKLQDAALAISPHYHVQDLYDGLGHQSYIGLQKSSHELELNDFAVTAIRQRTDLLNAFISRQGQDNPKLEIQLRRAMEWLAKSRRASSSVEQFLCIWIALEYLLVKNESQVIKDTVSNAIATVMGRGDRVAKSWWRKQSRAAYDLRCGIVHNAEEEKEKIQQFTPLMRQAAFAVIWHSAKTPVNGKFSHPSDVIDQMRSAERNSETDGSEE